MVSQKSRMGLYLAVGVMVLSVVVYVRLAGKPDWLVAMGHLARREAEAKALQALLAKQARKSHDRLIAIYPRGYVLIGIDNRGKLLSGSPNFSRPIGVDWDQARVVQISEDHVSVVPPGIHVDGHACVQVGKIVTLAKKPTYQIPLCRFKDMSVHLMFLSKGRAGMVGSGGNRPRCSCWGRCSGPE